MNLSYFYVTFARSHTESILVRSATPNIAWKGSWIATYLRRPKAWAPCISCHDLFSDVLYRPFFCAQTPLEPFATKIPTQNEIPRLQNLSPDSFASCWAGKPFILTDPVRQWPVFHDWSTESLLERYGEIRFRAEAVDWPLQEYVSYMKQNEDESPLYLFDRSFVEKMGLSVGKGEGSQYWTPECFGEDLFAALGDQRPDSRWLIMGPERSGSTFHKDPNATR